MKRLVIVLISILIGVCCGDEITQASGEGGRVMKVTSPSFKNNEKMPAKFTYDGEDISPELNIENLPEGTKSLALIVDDPDAPMKTWVHWVVYDILPVNHIGEGSIPGKQGVNDSGGKNYHGPCPPSGIHRYYFKVYALDKVLGIDEGVSKKELENAMQSHVLGKAELMGTYARERYKK